LKLPSGVRDSHSNGCVAPTALGIFFAIFPTASAVG